MVVVEYILGIVDEGMITCGDAEKSKPPRLTFHVDKRVCREGIAL